MFRLAKIAWLILVVFAMAVPALAAAGDDKKAEDTKGMAAGPATTPSNLAVLAGGAAGAGLGFSRRAGDRQDRRSAVESMARQPEVAGNIQTAMIIAAALSKA